MVAIVLIREKNGAGQTPSDKSGDIIRFKAADNAVPDANNPLVIPISGSVYSFDKWVRLFISQAPDNQIENLKCYSDGGNGFGTGVSAWFKTAGSYSQPTAPTSNSGYTDLFTTSPGSPIALDAINSGPFSSQGVDVGDYLQMMLEVASTATQGAITAETLTFSYDES